MPRETDPLDPKNLIRESYRIEGIEAPECRSIFLDWALSLSGGQDPREAIGALIERYGDANPDHPMTQVLREGMRDARPPRRRGGSSARVRS